MLPSLGVNCISKSIESVKSVEYCSIRLICLLIRIIMSVGYKPYCNVHVARNPTWVLVVTC
jgi:hypothetical protein